MTSQIRRLAVSENHPHPGGLTRFSLSRARSSGPTLFLTGAGPPAGETGATFARLRS